MPIVIGPCSRAMARFGLCATVLFFFMAGLLCTLSAHPLGAYRIPPGDRPSHSISVTRFQAEPRPQGAVCDMVTNSLRHATSVLSCKFIELVFARQIPPGNARANSRDEFRWFLWGGLWSAASASAGVFASCPIRPIIG